MKTLRGDSANPRVPTPSFYSNTSYNNLFAIIIFSHRTKITINNTLNTSVNGNSSVENRNEHEPDGKASLSGSNCDNKSTESSQVTTNDATYASQLSLENPAGFSRDAFGRQSMSEKRHATLDAKNTDTYQRTKKLREERDKSKNLESKSDEGSK